MSKSSFRYQEEYRDRFLESENITFKDGSVVTPAEIWDYLTNEAPKKYPYAFEENAFYGGRASQDVTLPAALKNTYLALTLSERMEKAKDNGVTIAFIQGGQAVDPYTAAGAIALRPALVNNWHNGRKHGYNVNAVELDRKKVKERAYRAISFEACNTAGYEHIQEDDLRIDIVAPYSALRCSDISYSLESHRHGKREDVKLFLADYPMSNQADKKWAIEYFAKNLRKLVENIDEISGKKTTDEDLRNAIKLHNTGRKLAMELADLWLSPDTPPTNGADRSALFTMGALEIHGDTQATLSVLKEAKQSIGERVKKGVKGFGIVDNPKRLFVLGSCVSPNNYRTEEAGGIVVGTDNGWSHITTLVEEEGDPYFNLAKATLEYPYEQSIEKRAAWTIEQIKKSRADGVIFLYNWGCNTQSAIARAVCDVIKRETGLPTLVTENELRGLQPEQQQNRINAFVEMIA
ncbi:MAG TPA: 2-hydroxyacyl-CoA dehydratase family protein [Bacillota bacterium]|nr:2-hydroxyacyl-CoA dehydratase family protein [Bacillota bacterium]